MFDHVLSNGSMARKSKKKPRHVRFGSIGVYPVRDEDGFLTRWKMALPILEPKVDAAGQELRFQVPDFVFFDTPTSLIAAESARALAKRLVKESVLDVVYVAVYDKFRLKKTEEYTIRAAGF